jgi:hypothetical protein
MNLTKIKLKILNFTWWIQSKESNINIKIIKKILDTNLHLPKCIRNIFLSLCENISIIISRYLALINNLYMTIFLIQGFDKYTKKRINIIYIANNNKFSNLHDKLFIKGFQSKKIKKSFIWNIKKNLNSCPFDYDAIFIKNDIFFSRFFEKKGFIVIPEFISFILDTSKSSETITKKFKKSIKEDIRKIKKICYTYEITSNPEKVKMFYNQMFLPYIKNKYGKLSDVPHYEFIRYLLERNSKLILTKLNNEYLYGALFSLKKDQIKTYFSGLMNGKINFMKKGLGATPYYFLIFWAKKNGYQTIDFGKSNPFFTDGLLRYKIKWGMSIKKPDINCQNIIVFKIINSNQGIKNFLINNPLISLEKNNLKATIFLENKHLLTPEKIQSYLDKYNISDLTELQFKSAQDLSEILTVPIK